MKRRKTAGELAIKAASDSTKYNSLEVGYALADDVLPQIEICIERHKSIIDEPEFCVVMILADDPLIKGVLRRKFYAFPYLPKPRPRQAVFLYRRENNKIIRLWVLPDAITMAVAAEMANVSKKWETMKSWSDAFYVGWQVIQRPDGKIDIVNKNPSYFFNLIRKQHGITLLSETEYLNANREKFIQAGCKEIDSLPTDPFDFSKVSINKIVDTKTALIE